MTKVILISQLPLPYSRIGSWTTLYQNYFNENDTIDYIICEKPDSPFKHTQYEIVNRTFAVKLKEKYYKNNYIGYLEALEKILITGDKCILQIVDNFGIIKPLQEFLKLKNKRHQCYIQFFYHGFAPFYGNLDSRSFYEFIDEMVLLTEDSYKAHKEYYTILPTRFSVLHNGVDTRKFHTLSKEEKQLGKEQFGVAGKKVFVWCSQDRPKKGLHIVLDAWKRVIEKRKDIALWVIGTEPKEAMEGVRYFGRIPNDELAKYLQLSDCYLFPTLWHEGFGLSLIEALHCGNYCIASANGGVPEVLQYGKFGKLIAKPNFVSEWENAILEYTDDSQKNNLFDPELYTTKSWNAGMNSIIASAKKSIS